MPSTNAEISARAKQPLHHYPTGSLHCFLQLESRGVPPQVGPDSPQRHDLGRRLRHRRELRRRNLSGPVSRLRADTGNVSESGHRVPDRRNRRRSEVERLQEGRHHVCCRKNCLQQFLVTTKTSGCAVAEWNRAPQFE